MDHTVTRRLDVIGAPSSAGAYAPGQERAPRALRAAGLLASLDESQIAVRDRGDVPGFRWRVDRANPRAMNADAVASVACAPRRKPSRPDSRRALRFDSCWTDRDRRAGRPIRSWLVSFTCRVFILTPSLKGLFSLNPYVRAWEVTRWD